MVESKHYCPYTIREGTAEMRRIYSMFGILLGRKIRPFSLNFNNYLCILMGHKFAYLAEFQKCWYIYS